MRRGLRTIGGVAAAMLALGVSVAAAEVPPAVRFLIAGLNAQLPRKLGADTTLARVGVDGGRVDALLVVEPNSPLALGVDVQREAARLCGIDVFRTLTRAMKAQLHIAYVKPDQTPVGEVTLDRTACSQ